jgi:hypothetical protein
VYIPKHPGLSGWNGRTKRVTTGWTEIETNYTSFSKFKPLESSLEYQSGTSPDKKPTGHEARSLFDFVGLCDDWNYRVQMTSRRDR